MELDNCIAMNRKQMELYPNEADRTVLMASLQLNEARYSQAREANNCAMDDEIRAHQLLAATIALTPHTGWRSSPTRNVMSHSSGMTARKVRS